MAISMNDVLKGSASLAILLAGGAIAYHFLFRIAPEPLAAATATTTHEPAQLEANNPSDPEAVQPSRSASEGDQLEKIFYAFATEPNVMKSPVELANTFNSCERSGPDPAYDNDGFAADFLDVASGWDLHIKCKDVQLEDSDLVWENVDFDNRIDLLMESGARSHAETLLITAKIVNNIDIPDSILSYASEKLCDPQAFYRHVFEVKMPGKERYWALANIDSGTGGTWGSVYLLRDERVMSRLNMEGWKPC